jgi:hypothetical protein
MLVGIQNIKEHFLLYSWFQSAWELATLHKEKIHGIILKNQKTKDTFYLLCHVTASLETLFNTFAKLQTEQLVIIWF